MLNYPPSLPILSKLNFQSQTPITECVLKANPLAKVSNVDFNNPTTSRSNYYNAKAIAPKKWQCLATDKGMEYPGSLGRLGQNNVVSKGPRINPVTPLSTEQKNRTFLSCLDVWTGRNLSNNSTVGSPLEQVILKFGTLALPTFLTSSDSNEGLSRKGENGTSPSLPNSPLSKPPVGQNTGKQTPTGQQAKSDATRLNDLYNSGAGEEEDNINLGTIHFGISYDFQNQNLVVKILQAKSLPAKDISGTSDPYVKLFLLPDRKSKMETRVKKKCLNPIWNETFLYEGFPYHKLQNRILNLQVYDYDRFSKDDPIGEIFLPLNEVDLSQFPHYWKKLIPMDKASKTGEILLTITYIPGPGKLIIEIVKCKNLKPTDVIGSSDPYIKLWLMENGKKIEKQKTQIKFNNLNPVYQESFTFMVPTEKIRSTSILVSALDYDRFTRNDTIGSFLLSSRSSPMEMKHWKDMLLNPGKPITQWHFLRT